MLKAVVHRADSDRKKNTFFFRSGSPSSGRVSRCLRYLEIPNIDFIQGFGLFIEILSRFIHNFGPGVAVVSWRQCFSGAKLAFLLASLSLSAGVTVVFNWCHYCCHCCF